jgi:hypothetical protein
MAIDWIEVRCPCCRTLLLIALPAMKGPAAPFCEECGAALDAAALGTGAATPTAASTPTDLVPLLSA